MQKSTKILLIVFGTTSVVGLIILCVAAYAFLASGVTRPADNMFGDQHLKTTVALLELHKIRYGRYPQRLSELRFTGQWDQLALIAAEYCANPDGTRYFVEIRTGWMGRPDLKMPDEFWQHTGYDPSLGPCKRST